MLHNTWVEIEYRCNISCATNGRRVKVYGTQGKKKSVFTPAIGFIYRFVLAQSYSYFFYYIYKRNTLYNVSSAEIPKCISTEKQ